MAIKYCDKDSVKGKTRGKIRFTSDPNAHPDRMSETLLTTLIEEAEAQLEIDLSPRYKAPFQTTEEAAFASLPDSTKMWLKMMAELKAVINVLDTDFGSGTATDGSKYKKNLAERYDKLLEGQLAKRPNSFNMWAQPPLASLMVADHNTADDGFAGEIHVTHQGDGSYPQYQINDPSESFGNGALDNIPGSD